MFEQNWCVSSTVHETAKWLLGNNNFSSDRNAPEIVSFLKQKIYSFMLVENTFTHVFMYKVCDLLKYTHILSLRITHILTHSLIHSQMIIASPFFHLLTNTHIYTVEK